MTAEAATPGRIRLWTRVRAMFSVDAVQAATVDGVADNLNKAWMSGYEEMAVTGFWAIARGLPELLRMTVSMAFAVSRAKTSWMLGLQVLSGICQAVSLFATTGVLGALFAAGPTPDRVAAALPSLIAIGVFTAVQSWANSTGWMLILQLAPHMDQAALGRMQQLCAEVELVAFDGAGWMDAEVRAERGAISPRYLLQSTVRVLRGLVSIAAAAAVLTLINPLLLPLLALTIAPKMWAQIRSARLNFQVFVRQQEGRRQQNQISSIGASTGYAPEVRALGLAGYLTGRYREMSDLYAAQSEQLARATSMSQMLGDGLSGIATAGAYAVLLALMFARVIPIAEGGTAFFAIGRTQSALLSLVSYTNDLYAEGLYLDGYNEFCAAAEACLPAPATADTPDSFDTITVDAVHFTYTGANRPAVNGASFRIAAGQVVALVGENGAAKTTLAKLLNRLYQPDAGRILWDDVDIAHVDPDRLRRQIAYIAQDGMRAPFTAAENIRIGDWRNVGRLDLDTVRRAALLADADGFISALPDEYATLMDRSMTGGSNISGGEWQRLISARGLLKTAKLIIADEPTAHLDAQSEIEFYRRLRGYGGSTLLVTHRMNAVRSCADWIVVVEDGAVTATGTHQELMAFDNWYRRSFLLQQGSFNAADDNSASRTPA